MSAKSGQGVDILVGGEGMHEESKINETCEWEKVAQTETGVMSNATS